MSTETVVRQGQISRFRWWIHFILIGGYVAAAIPLGLLQHRPQPALRATTQGLLIVCTWEIGIFAVVFGFAWLASRASAEDLLLKWRHGWWAVPLGIGYLIALRVAVASIVSLSLAILLLAGLLPRESLAQFSAEGGTAVERNSLRNFRGVRIIDEPEFGKCRDRNFSRPDCTTAGRVLSKVSATRLRRATWGLRQGLCRAKRATYRSCSLDASSLALGKSSFHLRASR